MSAEIQNFYLSWLAKCRPELELADRQIEPPAEKLLQGVWAYQRLHRDRLKTLDGQQVRVVHPGFWNREAGPDFQKAILQIGEGAAISGDIEIDLVPAGWEQHAHRTNPNYSKVVLHVIWDESDAPSKQPALALKPYLDAPLEELAFWLSSEGKGAPAGLHGHCSAPFRTLDRASVASVLRQAAEARLQRKATAIQAIARAAGWEQALWEGLFSALGYKRNVWPMRRLAELRGTLLSDAAERPGTLALQARLFGLAGLLPSSTESLHPEARAYVRQLWEIWWRETDQFRTLVLPKGAWNFAGTRPANHPERRLALASHWLANPKLLGTLDDWMGAKVESPDYLSTLEKIFGAPADAYWSNHWTFRSAKLKSPQPLLGEQRLTDLAMNVVLPWMWIRAVAGKNREIQKAVELRYFNWPAGEDNAVLKLARERLFGSSSKEFLRSAAEQQGMMQIVRDFCDYSDAACQNCHFPELLKAFALRA